MLKLATVSYYLFNALQRIYWDPKRLEAYQNKRLRKVVDHAYWTVPFYNRLFKSVGLTPSDIRTADDLNRIPVVRKGDMKRLPETEYISSDFSVGELRAWKTGGSTGEPFSIFISDKEDSWRKSIYMRANISCGQRPRDRWVSIVDAERMGDTTSLQHSMGIYAQTVIPVIWSRAKQLESIGKLKPDVLDGFSSALWLLAREAELRGTDSIRPRLMFGSGEVISQSTREYLEKVFGAPYLDQFGCTEVDRSSWQCPHRIGYHMDVDSVIMQFVDENGEEVNAGERGEIAYTSLFNYAMPFIRYSSQDMGVPINDECVCGRKLPLMKDVEGRSNSFLVFPDGHVVSPMSFIETLKAFSLVREIDQYRVVQQREDLIEIYVKKAKDHVDEKEIGEWLVSNVLQGLPKVEKVDLSKVTFEVKFVNSLPMTGRGKHNVVISHVANSASSSKNHWEARQ